MKLICKYLNIEGFNPICFSLAGRTDNYENITINLSTQIANSTNNYIRETFLSSFYLTSKNNIFDLNIAGLGLSVGSNT
jgi:hypothetical protein